MDRKKKIVLVGYPNSGKTTFFNKITSKKAKVVNYPGSTVSLNVAKQKDFILIDTPGMRSMSVDSLDEEISLKALKDADAVILVLNGTRLATQVSLAYDLLKKQVPMSILITRSDLNSHINSKALEDILKLNIFAINAKNNDLTVKTLFDSAKLPSYQVPDSIEEFKKQILDAAEIDKSSSNTNSINEVFINSSNNAITLKNQKHQFNPKFDLDHIFLHPIFGPFLFIGVMGLFFYCIYNIANPLIDLVDIFFVQVGEFIYQMLGSNWMSQLLIDGIWTGIGAVLVFTPQILILFFAIGILEQSGYLVRAAMIVDRPLSKIGLNGRSFVPLLSGCACAIPALMATRNIQDKKVRQVCQFIIPLMQCSARLPVYGLLLGILFVNDPFKSGIGLTLIYILSFFIGAIIAGIVSKILKVSDQDSTFQLELPRWKVPDIGMIINQAFRQTYQFIKRAGPIIAILSIVIWITATYPEPDYSIAMFIGKILEPIFIPMGLDWRVGVALLLAFVAREVFVSVLAIMFAIGTEVPTDMVSSISAATFADSGEPIFTTATSIGLIVFFIISMQCMATLATARQEMGNWKIPLIQLASYVFLAYFLAVLIVQGTKFFI